MTTTPPLPPELTMRRLMELIRGGWRLEPIKGNTMVFLVPHEDDDRGSWAADWALERIDIQYPVWCTRENLPAFVAQREPQRVKKLLDRKKLLEKPPTKKATQ